LHLVGFIIRIYHNLNVKFVRAKDNQYWGEDDKKQKCHEYLARTSSYQTTQQPVMWKLDV